MKKLSLWHLCMLTVLLLTAPVLSAADSYKSLNGTMTPISLPDALHPWWPDSLSLRFVNHVGRHGARFLSSESKVLKLEKFLKEQNAARNLSDKGEQVMAMLDTVRARTAGRWGALTELGRREEETIASLTFSLSPELFHKGHITSLSSYVPRVVESQYSFCLALADSSSHLEIVTAEGRNFDILMRPFDYFKPYKQYRAEGAWKAPYSRFEAQIVPVGPARRLLKDDRSLTDAESQTLALDMYGILQGMEAAGIPISPSAWFSVEEYRECAVISNLARFCRNSINPYSTLAGSSAAPLLENLILTMRKAAEAPEKEYDVARLRFGHDETLMPLISLMGLTPLELEKDSLSPINVWERWNTAEYFPLAANLQLFLLRSPGGKMFVAAMLNERPVAPCAADSLIGGQLIVSLDDFEKCMKTRLALFPAISRE
ncbi:MAG: histidine phosphatase family protein [Bacteroidales bacterium]|nr:histidine phosphatase family protein [Bacteroidales bacterium]